MKKDSRTNALAFVFTFALFILIGVGAVLLKILTEGWQYVLGAVFCFFVLREVIGNWNKDGDDNG